MRNKIGVVAFLILGRLRIKTLFHFSDNFNIDIYSEIIDASSEIPQKDQILSEGFVDFLKRNKEFIKLYESDYYEDKSIEDIAKKINKPKAEVENSSIIKNYILDKHYPYRYVSSFAIDFELGGNYDFLKYSR